MEESNNRNVIKVTQDDIKSVETITGYLNELKERALEIESFFDRVRQVNKKENIKESVIFYYDPKTELVFKGHHLDDDSRYYKELIYIGTEKTYNITKSWGITTYESLLGNRVACVGRGSKGEWYGWSHRGHCVFRIGEEILPGHSISRKIAAGYIPETDEHCRVLALIYAEMMN